MNDFTANLNECFLEYIDATHTYLVDGIVVPSITQIMKVRFGRKYDGISEATLKRAADAGTAVHEAVENWCRMGMESALPEVRNFLFLKNHYAFEVVDVETPVILFDGDKPIAAGRMDLVLNMGDGIHIADIKHTATLDKEYLAYQLNLYRIAFMQSYQKDVAGLNGIHLRGETTRKFVTIPINEDAAWELVNEYRKGQDNEQSDFNW